VTVVKQITAIPAPIDDDHVAIVTATFEAVTASGGVDWGSDFVVRPFIIQDASTTYGDSTTIDETEEARHPYAVTDEFDLIADEEITAGIDCNLGSPGSVDFYDIKVQVVIVKR
jgi:hypothetical protein